MDSAILVESRIHEDVCGIFDLKGDLRQSEHSENQEFTFARRKRERNLDRNRNRLRNANVDGEWNTFEYAKSTSFTGYNPVVSSVQ